MKKIFLNSLFFAMMTGTLFAATPWWEQPTVCRLNPANCYPNMTTGYDSGMWDANAHCRGLKLICGEALINSNEITPVGKTEIAGGRVISSDYDVDVLNGDCFGVRKTSSDGSMVSVNGRFVQVWCNGILDNVDEIIETGEITYGTQPTCQTLATDGYVATQNGKCYGKHYDESRYYIECNGETPTLIVLNGADYDETGTNSYPKTQSEADTLFNTMYANVHANH